MKIIDGKENTDKILSRLQCNQDKVFYLSNQIENEIQIGINCCQIDGITIDGEFLTIEAEILTLG